MTTNRRDDGEGDASTRTQETVIEETVARLMQAVISVHRDRASGASDSTGVSRETQRQLQTRLLSVLDLFEPYREQSDTEWTELGPDGWSPARLRKEAREPETQTVEDNGGLGVTRREVRVPSLVEVHILKAMTRDVLKLAEELGFYPSADSERQPVIAEAV